MSTFADVRSFGCFVYFDGEVPARALLEELVTALRIEVELKISTKNYFLRWKNLRWKAIDEAIANLETLSITLLVGTPQDVRLAGAITIRADRTFPRFVSPPQTWLGAESGRWPEHVFTRVARNWLRISATQATPLSGGVLAAADLRYAKIEMTQVFEGFPGDEANAALKSFEQKLMRDQPEETTSTSIRRVYPTTLLGPQFASQVAIDKLVAAGAKNVEQINGSVIFDATPQLLEAWSPEYLAATVELRRLLWPMSFQNPADDPDRRKARR